MTTYQNLKSASYIDKIISFTEKLLKIKFTLTGKYKYSAYCPFHADNKDSFRVYVNDKDEVRFHCFGACDKEWDVFDLIIQKNNCSFRRAQEILAKALCVSDFIPYNKANPIPVMEKKPDKPVNFTVRKEVGRKTIWALKSAERFYHNLLLSEAEKYKKIINYLARRGVDIDVIKKFKIGYAPSLGEEGVAGRALINNYMKIFNKNYNVFNWFVKSGLFRLLNVEIDNGYNYYRRYIDPSYKDGFRVNYADYFAGRITFPIYDIQGKIHGFMGRRPDNRGLRWLKQQSEDTEINTGGLLYGIDKVRGCVDDYTTIILLEGIFDYFAFYNMLQDKKLIIVSTLGTNLTDEVKLILEGLHVKNIIVAFDWDAAGKLGIIKISKAIDCQVYYLGGMRADEDPADKLKGIEDIINGFSLKHLFCAAEKIQKQTNKPIFISHMSSGAKEIIFKPDTTLDVSEIGASNRRAAPERYYYDIEGFMPHLAYNHGNKAAIDDKIQNLIKMLINEKHENPGACPQFTIFPDFIHKEIYDKLGVALILWLRLLVEQQTKRRKIKETDSTIAAWLQTSRYTIVKYKSMLKELGFLNITARKKYQTLTVKYFSRK
ncbi:MAG TPA: hypothetical protein DD405_04615 [Desulfobacteraceae bacterium]|nr:hypothetical protein [Desulfobacteraceae bacterium]